MLGKNELDRPDFSEWNRTVRGFMRLWDIAEIAGLTDCLSSQLEDLPHSELAANLAKKGNSRDTYLRLFLFSLRMLLAEEAHGAETLSAAEHDELLLSTLDSVLVSEASPFLRLLPGYEEIETQLAACGGR